MGQQHRVTVKRKRRRAYLDRKKTASKAKRPSAKAKKTAAATAE